MQQQAHKVVEVESSAQVAGLRVAAAGVTFVVWRSLPERGVPALLRDVVRTLPGAHRLRFVFLLDPTAPRFSPTHPFYAAQVRLGLAVNVLLNGAWGNLYLQPRAAAGPRPGGKELVLNRLSNVQDLSIAYLGLNGDVMEPTNLEVRDGHILDIAWPAAEQQPRGAGLLDYAGRGAGGAVMGVMDAETMTVDPQLQWAVPAGWSLEDAATAPYAYAMAYLALEQKARLLRGERALVHDGWSAIGQAALDVALAIGADVYTTYRSPEERDLILRRFPNLPPDHVMDLQGERFELKLSMEWRTEDRQRRGYRVLLSTLSGEGLWASLRRMSLYARVVQINGSDVANGTRMGMSLFIKSTSFYGVDPTCLVHLPDDMRSSVHAMVQAGLDSGVVRPLDRTVLPASHVMQAVSYLDGHCTDKVVLEMGPSKTVIPSSGFQCDQKASYIVVGGCRSEALHTVDWLLSRGARCVLLAGLGLQDAALSQVTLRRLALMRARWAAHVTTVPGVRADTPQGAATLVGRAANMAPLQTVFVLPSVSPRQDEVLQALDGVLRGPGRESVLLVAVETSSPSGRVAQACAARRRAGSRATLVALDVTAPHLRVLALDAALADPQPVLHVGLVPDDLTQATLQERLCELLPQTQAALVGLVEATAPATRGVPLPSAFGSARAKSHQMHPVFLVAGLGDSPVAQMQPLARLLMANAVLLVPGAEHDSVPGAAAALVEEMRARQPAGPYTLVARGWAGCLALEAARLLEARGERLALVLLDCAPQDLQAIVQGLEQARGGRGGQALQGEATLQAWLLCSLLHLEHTHYDELEALPSWTARLDRALDVALGGSPQRAVVGKALDLVCRRLRALADYRADFKLNQTVVTLLRPAGSEPDDFRGLDAVCALHVQMHVVEPPFGTGEYWTEAARIASRAAYNGLKPMHLSVIGKTQTSNTLWQRLR
ncbi:Fatty acid synthase [Frankliniella fusca]|uniref:oleoyl-[acyl-carrier-protein] hydrolase n=1 Tax=Frankliniella fusca TaxID=407009 RepID=A0AAE1H5A9_9NEOP|nr:Fatty acid synthase [Frankliniella fusca]